MGENVLTLRQQRAISALLTERTVTAAAAQVGVTAKTIYRWLQDDAFRAELDAREASIVDETSRVVLRMQHAALAVIASIMANAGESASVRLAAAKTALDYSIRLRELAAIERRLAALERAQAPL